MSQEKAGVIFAAERSAYVRELAENQVRAFERAIQIRKALGEPDPPKRFAADYMGDDGDLEVSSHASVLSLIPTSVLEHRLDIARGMLQLLTPEEPTSGLLAIVDEVPALIAKMGARSIGTIVDFLNVIREGEDTAYLFHKLVPRGRKIETRMTRFLPADLERQLFG